MPELPDIDVYIEKLDERIDGQILKNVQISKPFLVRSFDPPISNASGRRVTELRQEAGDAFPKRSQRFERIWQCMENSASPVRTVLRPLPEFAARVTRRITVPVARLAGRISADRSLSRLLKDDWPDSL